MACRRNAIAPNNALALRLLPTWRANLAALATELDFADQAQMTRAIVALTGMPPSRWV